MSEPGPLSDLRKSYELGTLEDEEAAREPLLQFRAWFEDALAHGVPEPNAMTLSTVGGDGRPSSRPVLPSPVVAPAAQGRGALAWSVTGQTTPRGGHRR